MKTKLLLLCTLILSSSAWANNISDSFWTKQWMKSTGLYEEHNGNYNHIVHYNSWHFNNRKILHESSQAYILQLEQENAFHIDPELEDYLYQLTHSIHPEPFPAQQRVQLHVRVIKSVIPDAFSTASGTIFLTTGMISMLHNEEELTAVLAREIAHISLDHNVEAYTAQQTKKIISDIIGTTAYAATSIASYDRNQNYYEAEYLATFVGISAELISDGLLSSLGVGYNRARTYEADEIAQKWMMSNNKDPYALAVVLRRLQIFRSEHEGTTRELSEKRLFLKHRFQNIIKKKKYKLTANKATVMPINKEFDTRISDCLKVNAKLLVAEQAYHEALPFLERAINSDWADGESYLLKAISQRYLKFTEKDNREILETLSLADKNSIMPLPWIWSEKALVHLRLKENKEALDAFIKFEEYFSEEQSETTLWAQQMIAKLKRRLHL